MNQFLAAMDMALLLIWIGYELSFGGGDPAHKDHNPPRNGV